MPLVSGRAGQPVQVMSRPSLGRQVAPGGYPVQQQAVPQPQYQAQPQAVQRNLTPGQKLEEVLANPNLEKMVAAKFRSIARPSGGRRARDGQPDMTPVLQLEDIDGLSQQLARDFRVDAAVFGEIKQMFWRFDFSGDGNLDENEGTRLIMSMLRSARDKYSDRPQRGVVKLGGKIKTMITGERYEKTKKLGEGGQGSAWLANDKVSQQQVVLKCYDKTNPNSPLEDITNEFELLMSLKHPRIAHVFDIFQDEANIYIVNEPYFGGDLTTAVEKATENNVRVNERWLARVTHQVLAGVAFLHSKSVMHCDLKEANVMIAGRSDWLAPQVVVIDFGLANAFSTQSGVGGTPGYMPPEVWEYGLWTPRGDVFSIGAIVYSLRCGVNPFTEGCQSMDDVTRKTREFPAQMTRGTDALKSLVAGMLNKQFTKRPSISSVMDHAWFAGASVEVEQGLDSEVLGSFARRRAGTDLERAVMADMAARNNLAGLRDLNNLFLTLDQDNDGVITKDEVRQALGGRREWTPEQIEQLLGGLMGDETKVSYDTFMGQLMKAKAPEENELLLNIFNEIDADRTGFLERAEVEELLGRPNIASAVGDRSVAQVVEQMDLNHDGKISFDEFRSAMQGDMKGQPRGARVNPKLAAADQWVKGTEVQYYSSSYCCWIPCQVIETDEATGAVQVSAKPGYWFGGLERSQKLRASQMGGSSAEAGIGRQLLAGALGVGGDS